jgi:hypothetical protein
MGPGEKYADIQKIDQETDLRCNLYAIRDEGICFHYDE